MIHLLIALVIAFGLSLMAGRTTGRLSQLWVSEDSGVAFTNQELVPTASKSINDKIYTDRFCGVANTIFDKSQILTPAVQGIVGPVNIIYPATGNDSVQTIAFQIRKDTGALVTAAADVATSITRPAKGKYNWNLIIADNSTGAITGVVGTDGDAYSDTFAAAGGPPLVAVDKTIVGAIKLSSDTAVPIVGSDITYTLSDNVTLIQERSTSNFKDYAIEGGYLLSQAMLKSHTGPLARKMYADYCNLLGLMTKQIHIDDIKLSVKSNTVEALAMEDDFADADLAGPPSADGSFGRFYVADDMMFKLAMGRRYGAFKVFPNASADPGKYYMFCAFIGSWDQSMAVGSFQKNTLGFKVDGLIKKVGF